MHQRELYDIPKIVLVGAVDQGMISNFDTAIKELFAKEERPKQVVIVVTTCGGSVNYSWGMYERIRLLGKTVEVTFFGLGVVYSAGIHLMMSVPKSRRITTANSRYLIHNVQYNDTLPMKNTLEAKELQLLELLNDLEEHKRYHRLVLEAVSRDTGISCEELEQRARPGWYFGGDEAVKLGLVGSLLEEEENE